ncbi:glycosyltransferase family 2 protein [Aquitalea sp. ASV11]|uniref:glycosyltransferase family 2 protein n=1 Tax=Aquitalea sp. ASV11 TaxID=2795103 RepID=UPI0018EB8A8F|nr:glycosyltransferase family 2 protein [Aquitalea sp. ASV11]
MNVLILAAGQDSFDGQDGTYPLCLTEIDGTPIIERLVNACNLSDETKFTFALRREDVQRYHLDNVTSLLCPNSKLLRVTNGNKGAACTALLASGWINNNEELMIVSSNELLDIDFSDAVRLFQKKRLDAGVITFSSVHPRYSYVRLDEEGLVVESAEKRPISRHAMAGFYWFACGRDFVNAAQNMIRKDAHVDGLFYIAPSLNDMILDNKRIGTFQIDSSKYHPLKTPRQFERFENSRDYGRLN